MKQMKYITISLLVILCTGFYANAQTFPDGRAKKKTFNNGTVLTSPIVTFRGGNFDKSTESYDPYLLGVYFDENPDQKPNPRMARIPIKRSGITQVKINNSNGDIHKGDPITSSDIPGEAMKATESGMILGIALEDGDTGKQLIKCRVLIQYLK